MPSWAGDAMALLCAFSWAASVMLFRGLGKLDPDSVNLFKNVVASVLLLLTMGALGIGFDAHRSATDWALLIGSGVLGLAIADTLFFAGLQRIQASVAAVTDCVYAPAVVLMSAIWLGEAPRAGVWFGGPLVVVGLAIVGWQPASHARIDSRGVAYAIGGVLMTAMGVVLAKPALGDSDLVEATTVRLLSGSVALFAFQVVSGRVKRGGALFRPQALWRTLVPATVLGTYISMLLWLGGFKYGTASRAALLNQVGAIFVLILSRLAGERFPRRRWAGAAIAIAGVFVVLVL